MTRNREYVMSHGIEQLTVALADRYHIERELGVGGMAEHEPYWQFAKPPAWARFFADPEGAAMLLAVGY